MRIESGPTGERKVRTLGLFLMITLFAAWYTYDGWIGYPKQNREEHFQQLSPEERQVVKDVHINEHVTEDTFEAAREAVKRIPAAGRREALEALYHGPPSYENAGAWYYFGPTFGITIPLKNGLPTKVIQRKTEKSATDIRAQRMLATGLGICALCLLWQVIRVRRTRLVLDEHGLSYRGAGPIGWDTMKAMNTERFAKKGRVDLIYDDNGARRTLRLDEYHLARFDEVVDRLCTKKGFDNPLPVKEGEPEQRR